MEEKIISSYPTNIWQSVARRKRKVGKKLSDIKKGKIKPKQTELVKVKQQDNNRDV